jgi:cation transport regulator ChaB
MTYATILELPTQVQNSLDDRDQEVWRKAYNALAPKTADQVRQAKREAWKACKTLPSSFSFKITASADAIDKDREIIDLDSIKKNMDRFLDEGGNIQFEHGNYQTACAWDWEPYTKDGVDGIYVWGNVYGGTPVYDNMRKSFVKGINSLSVAGEATMGRYQCDRRGCFVKRQVDQVMEISLCRIPANKYCTMEWYNDKASFTKSASAPGTEELRFGVQEYEIHKSYQFCPLQALKRDLLDIGYQNVHATEDGVLVEMKFPEFERDYPLMKAHGLEADWSLSGYACINDRSYLEEKAFKDGFKAGHVTPEGKLLPGFDEQRFRMLAEKDLICQKEDGFYFCPQTEN